VRHFSQIGGVYQRVQPGARLWRAPYQAAEKGSHSFCHSERSEESLFLLIGKIEERFLASLGMTK
jgi:hypothetical protein